MKDLVIATTNAGKLLEIKKVLEKTPVRLWSLKDFSNVPEIVEDQDTFEGNALKKARQIAEFTGKTTLADDSGLVVPALGGAPGVYSARYAGLQATDEENRQKLMAEISKVPVSERQAYFVCVLALVIFENNSLKTEEVFEGRCEGEILTRPRGVNGFGYDPLFFVPSHQKTTAEMSLEEKNQVSHRGRALALFQKAFPRL